MILPTFSLYNTPGGVGWDEQKGYLASSCYLTISGLGRGYTVVWAVI